MERQSYRGLKQEKLKKGLWSPEEDEKLFNYVTRFGVGCWSSVPKLAGLQRCGKSCRLRWINYLRPDLKRGMFSQQEEDIIVRLHEVLGNRWAQIATQLPGRTDNEIKNFWNSYLKKKLLKQGIDPTTHKPIRDTEIKDKSNGTETPELQGIPSPNPTLISHESYFLTNDSYYLSHGAAFKEEPFDSSSYFDIQSCIDPSEYNYNSHLQSKNQGILESNSDMGFNFMPFSTNFVGHGNVFEEDCLFQFQGHGNGIKYEEFRQYSVQEGHGEVDTHCSVDFSSYPSTSLSEDLTEGDFDVFQQL